MKVPESLQSSFLEEVRKRLPHHTSFADELAEILNISRDSAYRRMRGETVLTLDELQVVCNHFKVSLDNLLSPTADLVSFHHRAIDAAHFSFEKWLKSILENMKMINSFPEKELVYSAKDVPLFHYFQFPELAAFKMFFWMKSYHNYEQFADQVFSPTIIANELLQTGRQTWELYAKIPSTEIWSDETLHTTLNQINYYFESGVVSAHLAKKLYDQFSEMILLIQQQAADGAKNGHDSNYTLFKNEILIAETTVLFRMAEKSVVFITYNTMNILSTSQEGFCRHIDGYLNNLCKKSTLISRSGEKERSKFFNRMHEKIQHMKNQVV